MNNIFYYVIMGVGVVIAGISQILLKKSAMKEYKKWIFQYLNSLVICGYTMMVVSTVCTVVAMKRVPLVTTPIWNSMGMILAALFGVVIFKEKMNRKKLVGLIVVIIGIILFSL